MFVIDPKKVIRLLISYPAATGRNFDEILRSVQLVIILVSIQPSYVFSAVDCTSKTIVITCQHLTSLFIVFHFQLFNSPTGTGSLLPLTGSQAMMSLSMRQSPPRKLGSSSPTLLNTRLAYCDFDSRSRILTHVWLLVLSQDDGSARVKSVVGIMYAVLKTHLVTAEVLLVY